MKTASVPIHWWMDKENVDAHVNYNSVIKGMKLQHGWNWNHYIKWNKKEKCYSCVQFKSKWSFKSYMYSVVYHRLRREARRKGWGKFNWFNCNYIKTRNSRQGVGGVCCVAVQPVGLLSALPDSISALVSVQLFHLWSSPLLMAWKSREDDLP